MPTLMSAIVRALGISTSLNADLSFEKPRQILSVVRADAKHTAIPKMHDNTISAPQIPHPAAPDTHVNAQAVEQQCPTDFDLHDVGILHGLAEQWDGAEAD